MTLKNFPRGGKHQEQNSSNSLFNESGRISKKRSRKGRLKQRNENVDDFTPNSADKLTYSTISEGYITLGCIFQVTDYHMHISLPGGIIGITQVTDISDSYTHLIQNVIKSEDYEKNEFKLLSHMYHCGDYVICYVKSIQSQDKYKIELSLETRLINQNVDINYLKNGSIIVCTVSSIEDHGYIVDVGLRSMRAFIPIDEAKNEKHLFPGKQLLCYIQDIKTSDNITTVKLSPKKKYIKATYEADTQSLHNLMPGIKFHLHVKKILSNGLFVSFGNSHVGYINQLYLSEPLSEYSVGQNILGTLMYILPVVNYAYFTTTIDKPNNTVYKAGDIVEGATVLYIEFGGIVLNLTGAKGILPLKKTDVNYQQIVTKFLPGTTHTCRILAYSWMDKIYVCTMQHSMLQQTYFSVTDFKPGDILDVKIISINTQTGFVNVQAEKFTSLIAPEHVSDEGLSALTKLKINSTMKARVLAVSLTNHKVYFTLKKSLITSHLPVLSDIKEAKPRSIYHGTIIQIQKHGILVKFFGDVKGLVPSNTLDKNSANVNWNYSVGETILVKVESVEENTGKMTLRVVTKDRKQLEASFEIGEHVEGTIVESSIQGVYLRISKHDGHNVNTGFLPAGHMSPCMEIGKLLASKTVPGETLSALVFATVPSLILTRTFLPQEAYRNFEKLNIEDCIPCSVRDIEPDGIRVILPVTGCTPYEYISYSAVTNYSLLHVNQILFAKIISINKNEKRLGLTLSLKKIYDEITDPKARIKIAVDALNLHFNKLAELSGTSFYANRPLSTVTLGQRVSGKVEKITTDGLVVRMENNVLGVVSKDHYDGEKKVGEYIRGTIIWKNYIQEVVELTTLPYIMHKINENQNKHLEIPQQKLLKGTILLVTNWFILILLKGNAKGTLAAMPTRRHINDLNPDLTAYNVHSPIKCYIMLNSEDSDIMPICMVKSAFDKKYCTQTNRIEQGLKRKQVKVEDSEVPPKKQKQKKLPSEPVIRNNKKDIKKVHKHTEEKDSNKLGSKKEKENKAMVLKEKDVKCPIQNLKEEYERNEKKLMIEECGFFWDDRGNVELLNKIESSSDSEDEIDQKEKKKKIKLSAAERREQERKKEREIRQREEALTSNQLPNSVDHFDRLVLASPDSSIIWLQYMAYHLQTTEIEKARAVARRAVKTINFREEIERLNVWNAWLNLESKFGTLESLNNVFQEAVRTNDSIKIFTHMLTVHIEAGRQVDLEKTVNTMISKYKHNPQIWVDCGTALLKMGLKQKSRNIMQRALQTLSASEHVNLMAKFAVLENKYGDKDRAQTLFEQILSSYPKRVDIWSCYVDSLVKSNDIDIARKVLERAVVQILPPRKMKSLFKKFLSFEEQHGTQENVNRVQQMAVEYVEKQCNKNT